MSLPATTPSMRVAGRVFAWVLAALIVFALFVVGWVAVRGALAYLHLQAVSDAAATAREQLADPAQASAAIDDIVMDTSAAHELTSDPIWRVAETVPWIGPQLSAVSTIAASIDDVASTSLAPLVQVASTFSIDSIRPQSGRIDLTAFEEIRDAAAAGASGIASASASVDSIDRARLFSPLRSAVDEVSALLSETRDATAAVANASVLLPAMLGADGPRDYLVLFQNNAERRSLGGIPGAMSLIHTDGGTISLAAQDTAGGFPLYDTSVLPLDKEVLAIYGDRAGRWMQNVTLVPEFPVAASLAREMWAREHGGQQVDGVVALDPVTLSYILEATGPLPLPTGDVLTAENATSLLLNEVYLRYPRSADQDAFFAAAAATVFNALSGGSADPAKLVDALGRAGAEHRLLLWNANEADQAVLAGTTLVGGLPETDASTARFAVFLNNGTASKMDYYVTTESTVGWESCVLNGSGDATGTATLNVTLTSNAPADAATLPAYINGGASGPVAPGVSRTLAFVYLPEGFELDDATITGDLGFGGGTHEGRRVLTFTVDLDPGESATATFTAHPVDPGAAELAVVQTPTLQPSGGTPAVCGAD